MVGTIVDTIGSIHIHASSSSFSSPAFSIPASSSTPDGSISLQFMLPTIAFSSRPPLRPLRRYLVDTTYRA